MNLFDQDPLRNIIPYDGIVQYYPAILSPTQSALYFEQLLHGINWKNDEVMMFGKRIITKRKTAWYADNGYEYTYSKIARSGLPWTDALLELKLIAEKISGEHYNSCLLNLYHSGEEGMSWHSDDESMIAKNSAIASLSFGAERKFSLKHKATNAKTSILLASGSMLVMKAETQQHWLHALPKTTTIKTPRINLTFRKIVA